MNPINLAMSFKTMKYKLCLIVKYTIQEENRIKQC